MGGFLFLSFECIKGFRGLLNGGLLVLDIFAQLFQIVIVLFNIACRLLDFFVAGGGHEGGVVERQPVEIGLGYLGGGFGLFFGFQVFAEVRHEGLLVGEPL